MSLTVNVQEAKTRLSELLRRVESGEQITITHAGRAIAHLQPVQLFARTFDLPLLPGIAPVIDATDLLAPMTEDELLDVHVVVWLAVDPTRLSDAAREQLSAAQELHISAASAYEPAQKSRIGKLPQASAILARWDELVGAMGAQGLSLTAEDMAATGSLSRNHRDPFDRMLVAQARLRGLTLVTSDTAVREFDGVVCADWVYNVSSHR